MKRLHALALAAIVGSSACSKREAPPPPPPAAAPSSLPADRLLPGELAEGRERAIGLVVPRDMQLVRVFDDSAVARGRVDADALVRYVRARLDTANAEIGAAHTLFARAHVKGAPAEKIVRIEVTRQIGSTELYVRDITPPPVPAGLSEEERWKKAGVTPGKPLNPDSL